MHIEILAEQPTYFSAILGKLLTILKNQLNSRIVGNGKSGLIEFGAPSSLVIVGDIHGDLITLNRILKEIDIEKFLKNNDNKVIFLGDYIDRGKYSVDVLLRLFELKIQYPDSVVLMKGNHEAIADFPFEHHDLPNQICKKFGTNNAKQIYKKILAIFAHLPIMVIIKNYLLLVHGGLPTITEKNIQQATVELNLVEEILWNDPRNLDSSLSSWENSRRGRGKHFGKNITNKWIKTLKIKVVIRGHEPCNGYRLDHDDKILTLFSSKEPYPNYEASYLFLKKNDLISVSNAKDLIPYIRFVNKKKLKSYCR